MNMRERIRQYLTTAAAAGSKDIADELGLNRKSVSRTLNRMADAGEVHHDREFQTFVLSDRAHAPEPLGKTLPTAPVRRDAKVPQWNAGIEYDNRGGELRTVPQLSSAGGEIDPDEDELLRQFDLDPAKWRVTNLRRSRWQTYDERWLEAYRASFEPRSATEGAALSEDDVRGFLADYPRTYKYDLGDGVGETWMIPVGDLQLGKPDGGGSAGIVERFARCTEAVRADLEARGGVDRLILPWLGDCIEGIVSQKGRNVARLDRSLTEQVRLLRRLTLHQLGALAPLAGRVLFAAVPGNHDETTREQTMEPGDSWAVDAASAVADALSMTDKFNHVEWLFPETTEMGVTVNVGTEDNPYVLHFTHGHAARNPSKMIDWWRGQAHGRQQAGSADMLVTAHFHHFRVEQSGANRTWLQIPALDGGSDYFRNRTGESSPAGMVQLRLTGQGVGWSDLTIHG